jgi:hypothetical protein
VAALELGIGGTPSNFELFATSRTADGVKKLLAVLGAWSLVNFFEI